MNLSYLFFSFFVQNNTPAPLMLPDSVQKANFAQSIHRLMNIDFHKVFSDLCGELIWIAIKLLIAVVVYMIGRWVLHRIIRLVNIVLEHRQVDASLRSFVNNTVKVIFTVILLMIVVQTLGVNVTSLIALFSAATLAIGMALSGTAQNFAGGIMILVMKPYRVGDFISAQGQMGTVHEIKLFSTVLTTVDNRQIYVPNNSIATAIIDNYTSSRRRRVDWTVGISYGDDVDVARQTILEMFAADPRIMQDPAPIVKVSELADSSVNLTVRAWAKTSDYWDVFFDYNERIYKEFPKRGLSFPFPQMDVHLDK